MNPEEDLNGFPALERDIAMPELPIRATPIELARAYGTITVSWHRLWPRVVDALMWLRGAWAGLDSRLEAYHRELLEEVRRRNTMRPRPQLPSLSEYHPEHTVGGAIRVSPEAWENLQKRVADLDEALDEAERAKEISDAKAAGAHEALSRLEQTAERRQAHIARWVPITVSAVGILSGAVGWLIHHLWR